MQCKHNHKDPEPVQAEILTAETAINYFSLLRRALSELSSQRIKLHKDLLHVDDLHDESHESSHLAASQTLGGILEDPHQMLQSLDHTNLLIHDFQVLISRLNLSYQSK